ncbi:tyrosine-type recombinase/integrase [Butyrivibrio sp. AC2005]|uniref:tyrosine-type recombinase/integrase n=1 Tax=Butyrivibrio sp. AC2005 TaxID=1280672 RepID=UPI000410DED7|nr:tyrosine-type recombinase/integrase [Butyrivibrio sp. AC2005]
MGADSEYNRKLHLARLEKLHELEGILPVYCMPFLDDKELTSQINTVISYAYDLITFFQFLKEKNPLLKNVSDIKEIDLTFLDNLSFEDINEFQRFLSFNNGENKHVNKEKGIARRMSAVRGFYEFMCQHHYLKNNPTLGAAKRKKTPKKDIIRMNSEEVNTLMDTVINTELKVSDRQRALLEKTNLRDTAIFTLLLNTGIRVSECVGLDIDDINFDENSFSVVRKGGNTQILYFNRTTAETLKEYIEFERPSLCENEKEKALFLSLRKNRITVRSVQLLVKKFTQMAVPGKKLTPHKMRSTYGTALYRETGDIRLVADVLGHKDINTTAKHYAAIEDEHRRRAATIDPYSDK